MKPLRFETIKNLALASALTMGAVACGGESNNTDNTISYHPGTEAETTIDGSTTTGPESATTISADTTTSSLPQEDLSNPFNPTAEELAGFDCLDPENLQYGIEFGKYNDVDFVVQVLPAQMQVEIDNRDLYHREDSNSLSGPVVTELSDKEGVFAEFSARLCAEPGLEAAYIRTILTAAEAVGLDASMLAEFVGKTGDEISAMITNPHNEATFPADKAEAYKQANLEATKKREELATYIVAVFNTLQKRGNVKGLQLHSDFALSMESSFNPTAPVKFAEADYDDGDVFMFDYTFKGSDCIDHRVSIGMNTGATTPKGVKDDGDKRPVIIIRDVKCDMTEETTTTIRADGTTTTSPNTTTIPAVTTTTQPNATTTTTIQATTTTEGNKGTEPTVGPDCDGNPNDPRC